ncbi:MAG: hypothetical protein AAGA09_09540 [Pseudomonadota bacterium]
MKLWGRLPFTTIVLLVILSVLACASKPIPSSVDKVGDIYEIRLQSESEFSSDESSGNSSSRSSLTERVVEINSNGLILEFDLPLDASPEDRAREWQFPARVFRAADGSFALVNAAELKTRNQAWLERGGIEPSNCGRWIFTWTAVKIECDPQSVLQNLEPFDLRVAGLRAGAMYTENSALAAKPLSVTQKNNSGGLSFAATMDIDPEVIRNERAESDVVAAEITGDKPLSLEEALRNRLGDQISGTIKVTTDTDSLGRVVRRVRVYNIETKKENGTVENEEITETVQRELISSK